MTFRIHNMIKVPGMNFFNLSPRDAADMIEAFLRGGDEKFDYEALPEFRLVPNPVEWLEDLRREIVHIDSEMRTPQKADGLSTNEGRSALLALVSKLRSIDAPL